MTDDKLKHGQGDDLGHGHGHGCCEHDHDCCGHDHEQEYDLIELQDEDGNTHRFLVDTVFELDEKQYVLLIAEEQVDAEEPEMSVLRIEQDENGNDILVDLDEAEFEKVRAAIENGTANEVDFCEEVEIEEE
ncbi:MAG: DUF1292 domain-containing protein [Bacillota bacterium]